MKKIFLTKTFSAKYKIFLFSIIFSFGCGQLGDSQPNTPPAFGPGQEGEDISIGPSEDPGDVLNDDSNNDQPIAPPQFGANEPPKDFDPNDRENDPECGDGVKEGDEECDDGNDDDDDGCSSDCESEAVILTSHKQFFDIGFRHACIIDQTTREIKCFGENQSGELGQGNTTDVADGAGPDLNTIDAIEFGTGLAAEVVSSNGSLDSGSTCILTNESKVKCFGRNTNGELGKENNNFLGDGAGEMGENLTYIDLGTGVTVKDISTGGRHSCAILSDNSVKCWGYNFQGQLGQENTTAHGLDPNTMGDNLPAIDFGTGRSALQIEPGSYFTCALLDNNSVKCFGDNQHGGLGQEHTDHLGDGANEMGDNLAAIDLGAGRNATQLTVGMSHACVILDNGSVKCWGHGSDGKLGQGNENNLGDGADEMGDDLGVVDLGAGRTALQISAGQIHTCALLDNGSVKCWGDNGTGQLGLGDSDNRGDGPGEMGDNLPAVDLGIGRSAQRIVAGGYSTCAMLDNDDIVCWGHNASGQLGIGTNANIGDGPNEMGDNLTPIVSGF